MNRSAARMLRLLEAAADFGIEGVGLIDLCDATEIDKSTALRFLETARELGWLTRDPNTRRYALGPKVLSVAARSSSDAGRQEVQVQLERLRDLSSETASFHMRRDDVRVAVAGAESLHDFRRSYRAGEICSLTEGAASKAILAHVDTDERIVIVNRAGAEISAMSAQLEAVRTHGYLATDGDRTQGVGAVASPVFVGDRVIGSVALSGPSSRFDESVRSAIATEVVAAAAVITEAYASREKGDK